MMEYIRNVKLNTCQSVKTIYSFTSQSIQFSLSGFQCVDQLPSPSILGSKEEMRWYGRWNTLNFLRVCLVTNFGSVRVETFRLNYGNTDVQ